MFCLTCKCSGTQRWATVEASSYRSFARRQCPGHDMALQLPKGRTKCDKPREVLAAGVFSTTRTKASVRGERTAPRPPHARHQGGVSRAGNSGAQTHPSGLGTTRRAGASLKLCLTRSLSRHDKIHHGHGCTPQHSTSRTNSDTHIYILIYITVHPQVFGCKDR